MSYLAKALRDRYDESKLHILIPKANSGNFTYDGVDLGGERVTREIENHLEELARQGEVIKKISIIGYSLGGLVSRYVVGLLYSKGWFDKIKPVNFTTFATPHLGIRTPRRGLHNHIWNVVGARLMSTSGRQMFTVDSFRDTGRPLLSVLADPDSIFVRGLRLFQRRSLYANVVNDRSVVYYTAGISRTDPFVNIDEVECNYIEGYENVVVDPENPVSLPKVADQLPSFYERAAGTGRSVATKVPLAVLLTFAIPVGMVAFLLNAILQNYRSGRRIKLHERSAAKIGVGSYRIPLMVEDVHGAVETAFEDLQAMRGVEYLPPGSEEGAIRPMEQPDLLGDNLTPKPSVEIDEKFGSGNGSAASDQSKQYHQQPQFQTLALSPIQFKMINCLEGLFDKRYPVFIHKANHSHAAIIYRRSGAKFDEGFVVARHWLDHSFQI
ncbi:MAG: hypothetical protein M1814_003920 [Vezdaea aestivalis]|nr:MAG: hypothetical protein M1814_003920 [Vezdaea aestivalis]